MSTNASKPDAAKPANFVPISELKNYSYEPRKIKVISIGAGFSGLMLAHKLQHEFDTEDYIEHVIYEKNVSLHLPAYCA